MSTTYQDQMYALTREHLTVLSDALLKVKERCEWLDGTYDDHEERLEKLESDAASALANDNRNASATQPCTLSTTMENTIRLSCHEELADLVVKLCKHDEETQKLAINLLFEGEGRMCSCTSHDPRGSAGSSKRRRM